jgi:hypothetical protein
MPGFILSLTFSHHTRYIARSSHFSQFYHLNNIR